MIFPATRPYKLDGRATHGLTATVQSNGTITLSGARDDAGARPSHSVRQTNTACSDRAYKRDGARWRRGRMPIRWKWGRGFPNNLSRRRTRGALQSAHVSWERLRSNCKHSLDTYIRFRYTGRTNRSPGRDGRNLVDFGPLGSGALGVTYTWFRDGRMLESDMRLNSRHRWTNRSGGRGFRVANVATHELGHQLGLGHVGSGHSSLTMYSVTYPGENKKLTLGRGDLRGITSLYGRR